MTQAPPGSSYYLPMMLMDPIQDKVLIVASSFSAGLLPSEVPTLVRCEPGGTNCTQTDISAGRGSFSGNDPSAAIALVALAAHEVLEVVVDGYGVAADDFTLNVLRADGGANGGLRRASRRSRLLSEHHSNLHLQLRHSS